jgi:tripartite-type tricarboxylate transporter receptor subunit TctC
MFGRRDLLTPTLLAATAIGMAVATASAQSFPSRPMTLVVPFGVGSGSDLVARILGARMSELLGQTVVIENVSGAGGMTAAARVAHSPPDGYQFVLGSVDTFAINQTLYKKPLYNAATDFSPIGLVTDQAMVLIARKDFHANFWSGLFMAKGVPEPIVQKVNQAAVETLNTPAVVEKLLKIGTTVMLPEQRTPQAAQAFVESEIKNWEAVIKASGVEQQ